jgi:hypothetical protein
MDLEIRILMKGRQFDRPGRKIQTLGFANILPFPYRRAL